MDHAVFTIIDANHHFEDWTYMMPGDKPMHARFDLTRTISKPKGFQGNRMDREWNDNQPIYRQLRDRVVAMILDGVLKEGDPLPSVRNVAAEYRVNPLTVLKGYQQLVDEALVEKRRGLGMFINDRRARTAPAGRAPAVPDRAVARGSTPPSERLGLTPEGPARTPSRRARRSRRGGR